MGEPLLSLSSVYVQLRPSDGYSYSCAGRSNFQYGRSRSRRASFASGQHLYISSTNNNRCNRWRKSDVDRGQSSVAVTAVRGDGKENLEPVAVEEANERAAAAEEERRKAVEELGRREMELKEYADALARSTRAAVSELEAAKKGFQEELQKLVDNKLEVESELVLSRQNALDLALQVEKIAENAIEEATAHIVQEAKLRVSAAETSAAQVTLDAERHISSATDSVTVNVIEDLRTAFDKSLSIAQVAREEADRAQASLKDKLNTLDDLVHSETSHISLQRAVHDLERQLKLQQNETERLELELMSAKARIAAAEARAAASDKALKELAESADRGGVEQEENAKHALEELKRVVKEREEASTLAFNSELESMRSAIDALRSAESVKEEAYLRRFVALERALVSAEATASAWKNRSQTAEMLLQKANQDNVTEYVLNGGRMDFLIKDDARKLNLLAYGPRTKTPEWISRRLDFVCEKFPPLKLTPPEEDVESALSLVLPQPDQVWSIANEKRKVQDEFTLRAVEEEAIKKKRQALEQVLKDKTMQRKRVPEETKLEPGTGTGREIVFQGFNWESWRRRWYLELAPRAADLSHSGITSIWMPPPTESVAPQGYMPLDLYNLNSAYGTQEELKQCIEELHKYDLLALGDAVLNHRCAHKQSPNGVWNIFGGKLAWGPDAIVRDDPNFQGRGNPSSGDIFHAAPNIDHSQDFVRKDIKEWLQWLRTDIGFDGWRLDFVRGFWGGHVKEYIEASNPAFSIGEYWDSMAYEGGNLCYNQDAHRQRIINWINATGGTSSAFDVTTKGILHSALHNQYWRLIDPQGKPTGVMGWWPSRAVTYLENHDTGSTQGHWPFPRVKLMQGYAYILTHPGTPSIFYDHFYDFGLHDQITELIQARTLAGIHCRSPLQIFEANKDGYVAQVGEKLVLKLGHLDWNPSKQHDLAGTWHSFCDHGNEFKVWVKD